MKLGKKLCKTLKKSFSLVLALTIMLSVCAVSGMSLNVFAATANGQKIYINLSKNSDWSSATALYYRYTNSSGTVLKDNMSYKSNGVFETVAPAGAVKVELSAGSKVPYQSISPVATGKRRIYFINNNTKKYSDPYAYAWHTGADENAKWPGQQMKLAGTSVGQTYYYIDVDDSLDYVIFSDKGDNKTIDLTVATSYSTDTALYDAKNSSWANPYIMSLDVSKTSGDTEYYLDSKSNFVESKYLSVESADNQSKATYKTVYVSNDDWKSLSKVYATFDYNDAYEGTVELTQTTVNGHVVFSGKIPSGAVLRFHPNASSLSGASSATSYPTGSGYDGSGYGENTATYVKTSRGEGWTKFSDISNINYDAIVDNSFSNNPNIVGVDATYFDYLSDMEHQKGYLQAQGNDNMYDYWYQFDDFNNYISGIASNYKSSWKYPLYFGNMYKGDSHYETFKSHAKNLTNINNYDDNYYYAVNNSNGMFWQMGGNEQAKKYYRYSLTGLMYNKLDSKGNLQVVNGVKAPYFDAEALSTATYNNSRVANIYKSSFPFRAKTDSAGITSYEFTSKNATDNIYFTWNNLTPTKINYGAGTQYGVNDDLSSFNGGSNGYGIFPFNNTSNTSAGKGTNYNLDYGFGIRLDIDFRVPKGGKLTNGNDVAFNFTGDDDLWVYIGEDPDGADAELALDLGGDHKEASGSINFNTMTATADNVFADYSTSSSTTLTVPSDEIWVKTGDHTDFCIYTWGSETKYVHPYATSDGFYKFKQSQFGSNTGAIFCKWQNVSDGKLTGDLSLSNLYGNMWNGNGSSYTAGESHQMNLGTVTKKINNGVQLDPNKTYHMVVFYMERGESESNFSVNFTMTPANNDLKVTKTLDTGNVISEISDDLKAKENFDYTINENNGDTSGKSYKLTTSDGSTSGETLTNSGFTLKDDYMADFDNSFKTGSNMTVNESTGSSNLKYTTNWNLVNNRLGSSIKNGSTTNSAFKLVDPSDESAYAQLQLDYTNKIVTAPLEISKDVVDEDGTTDYDTDQQFTFAIALDFDGNGSKYSYKTYPLEYQIKEKGASSYSSTVYRTSSDGTFTMRKGDTVKLLNIPVGTTYKLTEKTVTGYVPYKVGSQDFNGTYVGTLAESGNVLDFVNKHNPTASTIPIKKELNGHEYTGTSFVYTLQGLGAMDSGNVDTDGNKIMTISTASVKKTENQPDENGKVTFKDLSYTNAGLYRFKITESLADGLVPDDFNMDEYTYLVEVELQEGGTVGSPRYIKVRTSDIQSKSDAELASYFNNSQGTTVVPAFENRTKNGSVTVKKSGSGGEKVQNTVFALVKVSEADILTDDDIKTIVTKYNNSNYMTKATTDSNGDAKFNNVRIFQTGYQFTKQNGKLVYNENGDNFLTGVATPQVYCLFEFSPSEGYNPTNVKQYFTLPVVKDGVRHYDITYDFVDGPVTMPKASGDGMNGYVVLGLSVAGLAATMFVGYTIYDRKSRKRRRARYRK